MTPDDAYAELNRLPRNDPDAAADFYRRALRAGVAWAGMEKTLARLQGGDCMVMVERLAQVWREEGSPDY